MTTHTKVRLTFGWLLLPLVLVAVGYAAIYKQVILAILLAAIANLLGYVEHIVLAKEQP